MKVVDFLVPFQVLGKIIASKLHLVLRQQRLEMGNYLSSDEGNFGFGFNDIAFSNRVLRLEIIPPLASNMSSCGEKYLNLFVSLDANDSKWGGTDLKVKKLHINSLILAAKSPFFYKLFKNGMRESQQKDDVTLRIIASEEAALMDLLNFMYGNPLSATSTSDLLDVLMIADKFAVSSCIRCCVDLLLKLPMSIESALLCIDLPSCVLVAEVIQPLIDAAKKYLAGNFWHFAEFQQKEAMALRLSALEFVLGIDGLKVKSEDDVFDFILKWVNVNYPKLEERQEILTNHLTRYICFQYMSSLKLKEVVECPDFDCEQVSKLVRKALICKDQVLPTTKCGFPRRVYKHSLIKVVQLEFAQPRCVVYFDITKQECADLFPSTRIYSEAFYLGGRRFFLIAKCHNIHKNSAHYFGLFLGMEKGSEPCTYDYEFAVMKKPSEEFQIQRKVSNLNLADTQATGCLMFEWTDLMNDESVYFIDGILHLRAQITVKN